MLKNLKVAARLENCFWVHHGPVLKNLEELKEALRIMADEQFRHHVNPEKNDFAKWVGEVLGEKALARALRKIKTKTGAYQRIKRELSQGLA